jgi:hypothetical protein
LVLTICLAGHSSTWAVDAFGVASSQLRIESPLSTKPTESTSSSLRAAENEGSRRGFIGAVKRLFLGAGTISTIGRRPLPVFAEELDGGKSGNMVEIEVTNLDGQPENKGTIKIQLKPEWAPRGVARFEVRL